MGTTSDLLDMLPKPKYPLYLVFCSSKAESCTAISQEGVIVHYTGVLRRDQLAQFIEGVPGERKIVGTLSLGDLLLPTNISPKEWKEAMGRQGIQTIIAGTTPPQRRAFGRVWAQWNQNGPR